MLTLRCAPRARLAVVPRRCSHRRTVEEKIEDLGGTVIDTSNQKSLVKAVQSRRPIEKPHKSELSMKRRRQEMNSSLFQANNLDELGYRAAEIKRLGYSFNQATYEALIIRSTQLGASATDVVGLWDNMRNSGFMKPSLPALESLVEANFREKRWDKAREYFVELAGSGLQPSAVALLQAYTIELVSGRTERAAELLSVLKESPDWGQLVVAHQRSQELLSQSAKPKAAAKKKVASASPSKTAKKTAPASATKAAARTATRRRTDT